MGAIGNFFFKAPTATIMFDGFVSPDTVTEIIGSTLGEGGVIEPWRGNGEPSSAKFRFRTSTEMETQEVFIYRNDDAKALGLTVPASDATWVRITGNDAIDAITALVRHGASSYRLDNFTMEIPYPGLCPNLPINLHAQANAAAMRAFWAAKEELVRNGIRDADVTPIWDVISGVVSKRCFALENQNQVSAANEAHRHESKPQLHVVAGTDFSGPEDPHAFPKR